MRFVIRDPKKASSGSRRFSALICETKIKNVLHFK